MLASTKVKVKSVPPPKTPLATVIKSPTAYPVVEPVATNVVVSTNKSALVNVTIGLTPPPAEAPKDDDGIVIVSPATNPEPTVDVTVTEVIVVAPETTISAVAPVPEIDPIKPIAE